MGWKLNEKMIKKVQVYRKQGLGIKEISRLIKKYPAQVRRYIKQGEHLSTEKRLAKGNT